jgi:hypothetical protein
LWRVVATVWSDGSAAGRARGVLLAKGASRDASDPLDPVHRDRVIISASDKLTSASAQATATAALVTVGSPIGQTPRNHQDEPTVAIDALGT